MFCKLELYDVEELKYVLDKLSCFVSIRLYNLFGLRDFLDICGLLNSQELDFKSVLTFYFPKVIDLMTIETLK